jgi:hypothetical protein
MDLVFNTFGSYIESYFIYFGSYGILFTYDVPIEIS